MRGPTTVTKSNQTPNAADVKPGSETVGDKLHGQKGNSPDQPLRSPNPAKCERMWAHVDNQDVGLEAATIERVRNSLLVECEPAPTMQGGSCRIPKRWVVLGVRLEGSGRGAFRSRVKPDRKNRWTRRK